MSEGPELPVPDPYVLRFDPLFRDYAFGGHALEGIGKTLPPGGAAESWEVSPYPPVPSIVSNGAWVGTTLPEVARKWQPVFSKGRLDRSESLPFPFPSPFPFLLKFLDVRDWLPVHVHPDDRQARELEGPDPGKEEAWLILETAPGAELRLGFSREVTPGEIATLARSGQVRDVMCRYPVRPGDVVRVRPGTPHAARGVVFLEIQQVSDRSLFAEPHDVWGRPWPPGGFDRQLAQFLSIARLSPVPCDIDPTHPACSDRGKAVTLLATEHFRLERYRASEGLGAETGLTLGEGPLSVTCLGGPVDLRGPRGIRESLSRGETVVIPAALASDDWQVSGTRAGTGVDLALGYGP